MRSYFISADLRNRFQLCASNTIAHHHTYHRYNVLALSMNSNEVISALQDADEPAEADRQHSSGGQTAASVVPMISPDHVVTDSLITFFEKSTLAMRFLIVTANYWPCSSSGKADWCSKLYFGLVRCLIYALFILSILFFIIDLIKGPLAPATVALTMMLDILSVLPAQYLNQCRLFQPAYLLDAKVVEECILTARNFCIGCMGTVLASVIVLCAGGEVASDLYANIVLLSLAQTLVALYLSFNLLFLMIDLKVSSVLIDRLISLADSRQLSMEQFNLLRSDIHRRVQSSKWTTDIIVAPCIASVFTILILLFHTGKELRYMTAAWVIAMTKELLFISVAFAYVAHVNTQADTLTKKLSKGAWIPLVYFTNSNIGDSIKSSDVLHDIQRLTMCVSSFAEPISFTLLFKRVSWYNVFIGAAGFVVALILGSVIKSQVAIV